MPRGRPRQVRRTASWLGLVWAVGTVQLWSNAALGEPKLQFVGEASIGWTDNVASSPDKAVPGVPEKSAGTFAVLSPSLVLAAVSPRFMQRLSFTHSLSLFFTDSSADSISNRLDYRGFYDISPGAELVLGASAAQTNAHTASGGFAPGASELGAALSGTGTFLTGTADEYLGYQLGPGWRSYQSVGVLGTTPIMGARAPRTGEVGGRIGVEHSHRADALGLEGGARYTVIENGVLADRSPAGTQRQLVGDALVRWRHDFGYYFTSSVEGGAMRVQRLNTGRGFWHPVGGASLAYATEHGDAELSYAHRVTTAPAVGQSLLADEVRLRGGIPLLDRGELLLASSAGYQRALLIESDASRVARIQTIMADVALGWQATDQLLVGPRYTYARQISDAEVPPLPLSFVRHTVMLSVTYKLPPDREMPRLYRAPRRVDRADEIREFGGPTEDRSNAPSEQ